MRKTIWILGALIAAGSTAAGGAEIGSVYQKEYSGAVGVPPDGTQEQLNYGVKVYANETVTTGPAATTILLFHDTSTLQVGNNGRVLLDNFVYDPAPGSGEALMRLGRGAFRVMTGYTKPEDNFKILTPTAAMTIRGTELMIFVLADGTTEVDIMHGRVETQPCGQNPVMMLENNQAVLVDPHCKVTPKVARLAPPRLTVPEMPSDLAALDGPPDNGGGTGSGAGPAGPGSAPTGGHETPGDHSSSAQSAAQSSGAGGNPSGGGSTPGGGGSTPSGGGGGPAAGTGGGEAAGGPRGAEGGGRSNP